MDSNNARKGLPAFAVLGIIAVVAALVLALTNTVTKGPIAEHQMSALRASFAAVMPAESYAELEVPENFGVGSLYEAKNGTETVGWCVTASVTGYGGPVAVTLGDRRLWRASQGACLPGSVHWSGRPEWRQHRSDFRRDHHVHRRAGRRQPGPALRE